MASKFDQVMAAFSEEADLIPALQAVQDQEGYLSPEALRHIAAHFRLPESTVFGVASFYSHFYLTRQGRHKIRVCCGTACHVRGGEAVTNAVRKRLGIGPGETTDDYMYTLERVACVGSCALAPAVVLDGKVHGAMTAVKAERLVDTIERQEESAAPESKAE